MNIDISNNEDMKSLKYINLSRFKILMKVLLKCDPNKSIDFLPQLEQIDLSKVESNLYKQLFLKNYIYKEKNYE